MRFIREFFYFTLSQPISPVFFFFFFYRFVRFYSFNELRVLFGNLIIIEKRSAENRVLLHFIEIRAKIMESINGVDILQHTSLSIFNFDRILDF